MKHRAIGITPSSWAHRRHTEASKHRVRKLEKPPASKLTRGPGHLGEGASGPAAERSAGLRSSSFGARQSVLGPPTAAGPDAR